jgi:hypothetical protein
VCAQLRCELSRQAGQHALLELLARDVVWFVRALGGLHSVLNDVRLERDFLAKNIQNLLLRWHDLTRSHGPGNQVSHADRALDRCNFGLIFDRRIDLGEQLPDAGEHDAGLAKRRQDGRDVLQEAGTRTHD